MTETALTVRDLVAALAPPAAGALSEVPAVPIVRTVIDSRAAEPGSLFIALRGEHHNGHEFVTHALAQGAVVVIAEQVDEPHLRALGCAVIDLAGKSGWPPAAGLAAPVCLVVPDSLKALQQAAAFWRRRHQVRVVGITGSIGKTTTKEVAAAVLSRSHVTLKSEGNYNNEIGLPLTLLHLRADHECVVLEMGMYDLGEIAELARIALPQVGVVTNVGPSHLERLGTIERIAQAKTELPQALPPAAEGGVAILNADDEWVRAMAHATQARVVTYGLAADADVRASQVVSAGLAGIRFRLHYAGDAIHVRVPLLGRHSVHTALGAAAVGLAEGLDWAEIVEGLHDQAATGGAQLRLVAVPGPAGSTILDDTYNASPASTTAALTLLDDLAHEGERESRGGRAIAVLGDMYELGSYEQEGHRLVGRRARQVADILVAVGRLGQEIGREALDSGMPRPAVHLVEDNSAAINLLRELIGPGDLVLVKGSRGMAMEEIVSALTASPGPTPDAGAATLKKEQE